MGCCCGTPADSPRELVGRWARDPNGSFLGYATVRRALYKRKVGGWVSLDMGPPNELLEIPERGQVKHVETFGGHNFTCWSGPVTEWDPDGSFGGGCYRTVGGCAGTLESANNPLNAFGQPWTAISGEHIHSILINGKNRLYRVNAIF